MRRKEDAQFNVRLSRPLLRKLQQVAKEQRRSINSEMIYRLEQSFEKSSK